MPLTPLNHNAGLASRAHVALMSAAALSPPPRVSRRVAVIGGGSGGVVAARFLRNAGHRPVIFEAGSSLGGVWADKPTNAVVYKNLQTNLPTVVMQSPDLNFPPGLRSYITKPQLGAYIESYAHAFDVASLAEYGARVTRVSPLAVSAGCDDRWEVQWMCGGKQHSAEFDAVAVANGHYEEPYQPELPGQTEWLAANTSRQIVHSRTYNDPEEFAGQSVLVVGGRSSGVDIARELCGVARWVYVLEKKCKTPAMYAQERVTHVPLGTRLTSDGRLKLAKECAAEGWSGEGSGFVEGPPVETVLLATGYCYDFPFLDEEALGMQFRGKRFVTPLYQHLLHAGRPMLSFIGIPLAVPCPIPFFEAQAAYIAEHWARPCDATLTSGDEREEWVRQRVAAVAPREQDTHLTGAVGGNAWDYMRELVAAVRAAPPTHGEEGKPAAYALRGSWLGRDDWEARLAVVEKLYEDRASRMPTMPWDDDAYRRCEYTVDWESGRWEVDSSLA